MSLAIKCVWCDKPLLDVEHAKKHVAEKCEAAPWRKQIDALADLPRDLEERADEIQRRGDPVSAVNELRAWAENIRRALR